MTHQKLLTSEKFNILWSNTETMKGALFARMPKADVRRRYSDNNPITRQVAIVLERALQYGNEVYAADKPIKAAIEDYLLPGRGVVWVVYEPIFVKEKPKIGQISTVKIIDTTTHSLIGEIIS